MLGMIFAGDQCTIEVQLRMSGSFLLDSKNDFDYLFSYKNHFPLICRVSYGLQVLHKLFLSFFVPFNTSEERERNRLQIDAFAEILSVISFKLEKVRAQSPVSGEH